MQLLSDVRDAFAHHHNAGRIFTNELLEYLHNLDHRTWHEWNKGRPMTAHTLSGLLRKSFNIYSRSQRRDKQKRRGYQQSDFTEAWERYLSAQQTSNASGNERRNSIDKEKPASGKDELQQPEKNYGNFGNSGDYGNPESLFHPAKSTLVSMSQFKARWAKGRSILKQFVGKAVGLFVATRT